MACKMTFNKTSSHRSHFQEHGPTQEPTVNLQTMNVLGAGSSPRGDVAAISDIWDCPRTNLTKSFLTGRPWAKITSKTKSSQKHFETNFSRIKALRHHMSSIVSMQSGNELLVESSTTCGIGNPFTPARVGPDPKGSGGDGDCKTHYLPELSPTGPGIISCDRFTAQRREERW